MSNAPQVSDQDSAARTLDYPFPDIPPGGTTITVAPGVHWLRMPLPFGLDHVNLWVLDDGDGVVIIDSAVKTPDVQALWQQVFDSHIGARPVHKIIITHFHPDHVGLAGWLHEKTGAPLYMSRTEYLMTRMLCLDVRAEPPREVMDFYTSAGWSEGLLSEYRSGGYGNFSKGVAPLPTSYQRLKDNDSVSINGVAWQVIIGAGHSPEHVCLYSSALDVLIAGDQVLPRISSNVSVYATEPDGDPLADWLRSLHKLKSVPDSCLVLPSHNEPFYGLHERLDSLISGHCAKLERLARQLEQPKTAYETLDTLFGRRFDNTMVISMATGESLAHLRFLEGCGLIERRAEGDIDYYQRTDRPALTRQNFIKFSESLL
ncbi:MAG: MBL fold metallo-hydrolase [Pseudomonadota bacterium]